MINCLANAQLSTKLETDGYVVIQICSPYQIENIRKLYETVPADSASPFWSSSFLEDTAFKAELSEDIGQILNHCISKLLVGHKSLGSSFLTKFPGKDSIMPIHQDWTVVDETKFGSYTIWMPLTDTDPNNGALQVIAGSHKLGGQLRSPSLPVAFEPIRGQLRPYLQSVNLKIGEAILFNHALMHASPPNLSNTPRVAVTFGFVPKEASLCMYYNKDGNVQKYKMPQDMFIKYPQIRNEPQIGELEKEFEYSVKKLTMKEVEKTLEKAPNNSEMQPLFKDADLQTSFEKNGFVKIPALRKEEVNKLLELYTELGLTDEKGYGFHVGMDNANKQVVRKMVEKISEIALPKVEVSLAETRLTTASFVIKEPNAQGVVPPHQDWSFVEDEKKHCSVSCWIPLQDVNMENGCIGLIKGSNRFFQNVRPSPSPQVETPLKKHMYTIFPYLELQEMKAGEALIFDNRTFHASPPNTTDSARIAIGLGFTQANAELRHYYLKPGTKNTLIKYKIDPDFFLKYDNQQLSEMYDRGEKIEGYEQLEEIPYKWENLSDDEMRDLIQSSGNTFNVPLVETMTKLFVQPEAETSEKTEEIAVPVAVANKLEETAEPRNPFWKTYSPANIFREVRYRITGQE